MCALNRSANIWSRTLRVIAQTLLGLLLPQLGFALQVRDPAAIGYCKNPVASNQSQRLLSLAGADPAVATGLVQSLRLACGMMVSTALPSEKFRALVFALQNARSSYEEGGRLSPADISLLMSVGLTLMPGKNPGDFQLKISADDKRGLATVAPGGLVSDGYLLLEAYHWFRRRSVFRTEALLLSSVLEAIARDVLAAADLNQNGIIGWGRLWFKGADGLLVHGGHTDSSLYFGGYTYFSESAVVRDRPCRRGALLDEEAFDFANISIFLMEVYLISRQNELSQIIISKVGAGIFQTWAMGGEDHRNGIDGWYYWKSLRPYAVDGSNCEAGFGVKNTNLRMGVALWLWSEIVFRNLGGLDGRLAIRPEKVRARADAVLTSSVFEILHEHNFGYYSTTSRGFEGGLSKNRSTRLLYDRTQVVLEFQNRAFDEVRIAFEQFLRPDAAVIICGGWPGGDPRDVDLAGSCWNHLAFEAEDYFRLLRFSDGWISPENAMAAKWFDVLFLNALASRVLFDEKSGQLVDFFERPRRNPPRNDSVGPAQYGTFCQLRNVQTTPLGKSRDVALMVPAAQFGRLCDDVLTQFPKLRLDQMGHKFMELAASARRFEVDSGDWLLANKLN